MSPQCIAVFAFTTLGGLSSQATQSVAESPPFGLNFDGRPSIIDTAPVDYVVWLTEFFTTEDLFNIQLVAEEADADSDGRSNRFEYLAALDPSSGDQEFKIIVSDGDAPSIEISPLRNGVNFRIEKSVDLESWIDLESNTYERIDQNVRIRVEPEAEKSFYRIRFLDRDLSI